MSIDSRGSREIKVSDKVKVGGKTPLFLIAGPCVIESEEHAFSLAGQIKAICANIGLPLIFKASYDKANRSSVRSFRGPGLEKGLAVLKRIKHELEIPVLSDVHETVQVEKAAEVLDVIQIPAFLCRQTDLIIEAARTGKALNLKKGQFLSPQEMANAVEKALSQGNQKIIITERGTSFGYNNLVFDVRSIPLMKKWGFPVVIDASHAVQRPGGRGEASAGEAEFIPLMVQTGVAAGADGVFIEVHDNPPQALSDAYNSLIINKLEEVLTRALRIKKALKEESE
ncbi:MAG: 3-deoxy-8-phosphooctulonate synthase [Clostridiales bacterium]|jgi:2-dehydro-3-deoxyphosphooctonate aldolase (KDO 8-P synthase)|nr:3-deoxy-8-phosphooctulonate synthase [Clostridiales bacterium]